MLIIDNEGMLSVCIHSIKYSCLYLVTVFSSIAINGGTQLFDDSNNIVIVLESQEENLYEYSCKVKESQIKLSALISDLVANNGPNHAGAGHNDIQVPLPYDVEKEFLKIGFSDMCDYFQNDNLNQDYHEYQLPMPLFLNNSNDFYNDATQLTEQEVIFMKALESFDDINNNDNPFDIDMTRMYNLFKIAEYLQIQRLLTIIAARQASLMMNMSKHEMIRWLMTNPNPKKPMTTDSNNNNNQCDNNNDDYDNPKMVPLLVKTHMHTNDQECTNNKNDDTITRMSEIEKYNWVLLSQILPFFSCYDIHTFSTISDESHQFANDWWHTNINIDPMIKVLTNDNDATCLSLTNQEVVFYKPFLTLPQTMWSDNQNSTYNQLKTLPNSGIDVDHDNKFYFETLISVDGGGTYKLDKLQCKIKRDSDSIEIYTPYGSFHGISFKFGNFCQQVNSFAQRWNFLHIRIFFHHLSSFNNLISINDIDHIKTIQIQEPLLSFINFEEIYNINNQLESLVIFSRNVKRTKTTSVKNIQFLSKMKSLRTIQIVGINLDSFNFDGLKGLTGLETIKLDHNRFNYKFDTQCLDFAFLNNMPNLKTLHLLHSQIECIINFMEIQKRSKLESLDLRGNKISALDLNAFQGTNIKRIYLSGNRLGSSSHDDDDTSQLQSCLDFNSFNNMPQLQKLHLEYNRFKCIINFESIQQHTQLEDVRLSYNHLSSSIDFAKFDESKPLMNSLHEIHFKNMSLKYTMQNNNCLDLQFLKFMPNVQVLNFSNNSIECVDNMSILQRKDMQLKYLRLDNNNLSSFRFSDLIGSNIAEVNLTNNKNWPSYDSLKDVDDTLVLYAL